MRSLRCVQVTLALFFCLTICTLPPTRCAVAGGTLEGFMVGIASMIVALEDTGCQKLRGPLLTTAYRQQTSWCALRHLLFGPCLHMRAFGAWCPEGIT
jgi:hypothetical protein